MRSFLTCLSFLIIQFSFAQEKTKDTVKVTELKEVVIQSKKKSIEQKAWQTIFDFSQKSHLNSDSFME